MSPPKEPPPGPPTPFPETEAQIRGAVLDFHTKTRCFDKRPIKYMTITAITPMSAYRYILETFVETRVISSKTTPFRGQAIPAAKSTPEKWSVSVLPPSAPPGNTIVEVYDTSMVIQCPTCEGTGRVVCESCKGLGSIPCTACDGYGRVGYYPCRYCIGLGRLRCPICEWRGFLTCPQCEGLNKVIIWNTVNVTWSLDVKTFNTSRGDLSADLLNKVQYSDLSVSQLSTPEDPRPLKFLEEPEITDAAAKYVEEMMAQKDWKVIALRQVVVNVPVVKVDWTWKNHAGTFYVYGADKWIHFPVKYPGSPCGGCCCCGNSPCVIV